MRVKEKMNEILNILNKYRPIIFELMQFKFHLKEMTRKISQISDFI